MPSPLRDVIANLGHFGEPEQEFNVPWTPGVTLQPIALKTDKMISFIVLRWRGRITSVNAHATTADAVRYLIQEIRLSGQHAVFGAQTPIRIRAKTNSDLNRIHRVTYAPGDTGAVYPNPTVMGATYDLEAVWTVPLFPWGIPLNSAPLYSIKGPDWAGNLFLEIDAGDSTAIGGAAAADDTFSAFGAAGGNPTLFVSVVRPNITVDLMNRISPAITFKSYRTLDAILGAAGVTFANQQILPLNIGKKMAAVHIQTGTLSATLSAGQRYYTAFSNAMVTRAFFSLDGKSVPNAPYSGSDQREFMNWLSGNPTLAGYLILSWIRQTGNADAAFPAETLTAARRFEIDGDVTAAATQGGELVQEEILGSPVVK